MSTKEFSLSYEYQEGKWQETKESSCFSSQSCNKNLKIGAFNVLWGNSNKFINMFNRNEQRFNYIINKLIPQTDPDILSLLEVSEQFMEMLTSNQHIRNNYYLSHVKRKRIDYVHEVVMISKLPFSSIFMNDDDYGRCIFSIFTDSVPSNSFMVLTSHFWAYEQDYVSRSKQMELIDLSIQTNSFLENVNLPVKIQKAALEASQKSNIILQGDLNLHLKHEDSFIYKFGFVDVWREIYPHDDGYTWDAQKNKFVKSIYILDNRRMRLDRILLRQNSHLFKIIDIQIKAQESIGFNLCCSDHYMLLSEIQINKEPKMYIQKYDISNILMEKKTGFRSFPTIIKLRILLLISILLGIVITPFGVNLLKRKLMQY
ncbi:endonuclease/exonuclease/phosphatase family protein (macronuclear) [Tetrahymena thermophila SB210]|uniref:Endonuclease/exonuclease/phosphatase family protein n=1 Tax=Tetrahymena thermophila (strain SB210) TaxID=312017 RepID=I7M1M8_TETTS|nr:endonuclease/exonuclease/phosphatase family protein [Tetrahymena thermophila SB210]EAR97200.2 endonuclease/exonuclease/phosphatase family protein [Tetrahymena thermophila SB210]|eukprot:XP_001017445.2 endonuclease/exonuclease/phosphatase family protein [Tetrahymena thermophila SB210]